MTSTHIQPKYCMVKMKLIVAIYIILQGILTSGVGYTLLAWGVRRKGPLFASAFSPLMVVILTLVEPLILDKCPNLGR